MFFNLWDLTSPGRLSALVVGHPCSSSSLSAWPLPQVFRRYLVMPDGVRYSADAPAGLAAVVGVGGVVLTRHGICGGGIRQRREARRRPTASSSSSWRYSSAPYQRRGRRPWTRPNRVYDRPSPHLDHVLAFILAAYRLYMQTGEGLFLVDPTPPSS